MGRKDALYFARQAERRAKHDPAAGGGRAAQSAAHNPIAELEAENQRLRKLAQAVVGLYGMAGTNMADEKAAINALADYLEVTK